MPARAASILAAGALAALLATAAAADPWVITSHVVISAPMDRLDDVIVATGGELDIENVPDPGFRLTGNLLVVGTGVVRIEGSVVQIMSTYHGQYFVGAIEQGTLIVSGCDYRVPNGVQHAIIAAGNAHVTVEDTDFGSAQLIASEGATLIAQRLDGHFEVLLQESGDLTLRDIPRDPGGGDLWVWPEFPAGSTAVYTPPMPGFIQSWSFPPPGATGFGEHALMERCQAKLWPLLVRPGSDLTLRDIPADNWVVVGLHLPNDADVAGVENQTFYVDRDLGLADRRLVLENAAIDTWNLYPEGDAQVTVEDCLVGEILALERSRVTLRRTTVDGSGGYFGVRDDAVVDADECTFTCDIQVSRNGTALIHRSHVLPYPFDTTGQYTRFGAYDDGRLLLDASEMKTRADAGGSGLIGICGFVPPPDHVPGPGATVELAGVVGLYSLDAGLLPVHWRVEALPAGAAKAAVLGSGEGNVDSGHLADWSDAGPGRSWIVRIVLRDGHGREMRSFWPIEGTPRVRTRASGPAPAPAP